MALRKEADMNEFTIHHTERVKVDGLTVGEIVATSIRENVPVEAILVTRVEYEENGPESFLEWNVSVAQMERMDRA